jgi:NADH-quinone oxidoreductase subunit D
MPVDIEIASEDSALKTEPMVFSMGPHHPSTHGVLRLVMETDGEVVRTCKPDLGYLHRAIEKIGECISFDQFMPYTDRVDYLCSMNSNFAYAAALEKLGHIDVPERAHLIRIMFAELNRISSHLICIGALAMDMGAYTPFLHAIVAREKVNDLFESACGARLTYNYFCAGGLNFDLPEKLWVDAQIAEKRRQVPFDQAVTEFCDWMTIKLREFNDLITYNAIFIERLAEIGVVNGPEAVNWGLVGPNLRASGVKFDLRKDEPYSLYSQMEFDVPAAGDAAYRAVGKPWDGQGAVVGDSWSRFWVRVEEIFQSIRIVRQCVDRIRKTEPGTHQTKDVKLRIAEGEVYVRTENPRGETGYWIIAGGKDVPLRMKIRTGSFTAMGIFEELCKGHMLSDVVAIIGSLDIVLPEVDR